MVPGQADWTGTANPQELNRYSYVNNNPLKYTDPSGHVNQIGQDKDGPMGAGGGTSGGGPVEPIAEPIAEPVEAVPPTTQMGPEGVSEAGETTPRFDESAKLAEARAARDSLAAELKTSKNPPAATTAGYNTETGQVAVCSSGGGMCAEDHVVQQLGGDPSKVRFTEATRARTGDQVPVCERCEATYSRDPFPEGTEFRSDRRPQ